MDIDSLFDSDKEFPFEEFPWESLGPLPSIEDEAPEDVAGPVDGPNPLDELFEDVASPPRRSRSRSHSQRRRSRTKSHSSRHSLGGMPTPLQSQYPDPETVNDRPVYPYTQQSNSFSPTIAQFQYQQPAPYSYNPQQHQMMYRNYQQPVGYYPLQRPSYYPPGGNQFGSGPMFPRPGINNPPWNVPRVGMNPPNNARTMWSTNGWGNHGAGPAGYAQHPANVPPQETQKLSPRTLGRKRSEAYARQVANTVRPPKVPETDSDTVYSSKMEQLKAEKPWIKHLGPEVASNARTLVINNYDPEEVYTGLPGTPNDWGPFHYNHYGELQSGKLYSAEHIKRYLYEHPLHFASGVYDPKESNLRLWIQRVPADSARRYRTKTSHRCRFKKCWGEDWGISIGHFRVAFDERSDTHKNWDPQLNTGYVHLYCLERHMDFPQICKELNVCVEDRITPKEPNNKNRMAIVGKQTLEVVLGFLRHCNSQDDPHPIGYPEDPNETYEGTLNHSLHVAKNEDDGPRNRKLREKRGEKKSHIWNHFGNLDMQVKARRKTRLPQYQKRSDISDEDVQLAPRTRRTLTGKKKYMGAAKYFNHSSSEEEITVKPPKRSRVSSNEVAKHIQKTNESLNSALGPQKAWRAPVAKMRTSPRRSTPTRSSPKDLRRQSIKRDSTSSRHSYNLRNRSRHSSRNSHPTPPPSAREFFKSPRGMKSRGSRPDPIVIDDRPMSRKSSLKRKTTDNEDPMEGLSFKVDSTYSPHSPGRRPSMWTPSPKTDWVRRSNRKRGSQFDDNDAVRESSSKRARTDSTRSNGRQSQRRSSRLHAHRGSLLSPHSEVTKTNGSARNTPQRSSAGQSRLSGRGSLKRKISDTITVDTTGGNRPSHRRQSTPKSFAGAAPFGRSSSPYSGDSDIENMMNL